jgi:hypothetical protein
MNQQFTIPEQVGTLESQFVEVWLDQKVAKVNVVSEVSGKQNSAMVTVDVLQLLTDEGYTAAQKTAFKNILKSIVAKAWEKATAEINDVF